MSYTGLFFSGLILGYVVGFLEAWNRKLVAIGFVLLASVVVIMWFASGETRINFALTIFEFVVMFLGFIGGDLAGEHSYREAFGEP